MDLMEQLMALLGKDGIPDDSKKDIKALFQTMTVEAGKAKTDLESYKKGDSDYKKLKNKLAEQGLTEDQLDSIAEQLGVKKTLQDEHGILKAVADASAKALKDANNKIERMNMENILGRKIEQVAQAYKTPDGKTVKISERFIDKNELFKKLDLESELLVQDRISKVMATAFENQTAFMKEVGMDGIPVHQVKVGEVAFGSGKALDTATIAAVVKQNKGSLDGAAQALTMYEQASKPTGT